MRSLEFPRRVTKPVSASTLLLRRITVRPALACTPLTSEALDSTLMLHVPALQCRSPDASGLKCRCGLCCQVAIATDSKKNRSAAAHIADPSFARLRIFFTFLRRVTERFQCRRRKERLQTPQQGRRRRHESLMPMVGQ